MSEYQLWNELGNVYINSRAYEQAIKSFERAIDANPEFGWAYSNMALAYMRLGESEKSIPFHQRSIELLEEFSDKAIAWHRLGNSYQVMDDTQNAILAFRRAVDLDLSNTVYRHDLAVAMAEYAYETGEEEPVAVMEADATKEADEDVVAPVVAEESEETEEVMKVESVEEVEEVESAEEVEDVEIADEVENVFLTEEAETTEASQKDTEEVVLTQSDFGSWLEKTIEKLSLKVANQKSAAFEDNSIIFPEGVSKEEAIAELMNAIEAQITDTEAVSDEAAEDIESVDEVEAEVELAVELTEDDVIEETEEELELVAEVEQEAKVELVEKESEDVDEKIPSIPAAIAKDMIPLLNEMSMDNLDEDVDTLMSELSKEIALVQRGDKIKSDELGLQAVLRDEELEYEDIPDELVGELTEEIEAEEEDEEDEFALDDIEDEEEDDDEVELDEEDEDEEDDLFFEEEEKEVVAAFFAAQKGKNGNGQDDALGLDKAKVWGDLGNIFFSAGIFDGALIAYEKAIKLDAQYAPVLNNLALLHVRNGEYLQAVDLYEKSIELLEDAPEKSISWNNLGNTYRVLEQYEQAKEAYRKADELDTQHTVVEKWIQHGLLSAKSA